MVDQIKSKFESLPAPIHGCHPSRRNAHGPAAVWPAHATNGDSDLAPSSTHRELDDPIVLKVGDVHGARGVDRHPARLVEAGER